MAPINSAAAAIQKPSIKGVGPVAIDPLAPAPPRSAQSQNDGFFGGNAALPQRHLTPTTIKATTTKGPSGDRPLVGSGQTDRNARP